MILLRRDMNQAQLAERMGVNEMWVSRRLRGAQQLDLQDLQRIADALDVSIFDLFPREVGRPNKRLEQSPNGRAVCVPELRPSAVGPRRRRPKSRASAAQPIAV